MLIRPCVHSVLLWTGVVPTRGTHMPPVVYHLGRPSLLLLPLTQRCCVLQLLSVGAV